MGSWEYYCAFCGCTFNGASFVCRKPRTARFRWRQQRDAEFDRMVAADPSNVRIDFKTFNDESAAGESSLDAESLHSNEEEGTYDPTIISVEEASWSLNIQCLGINEDSPTPSQTFFSDTCYYADYGAISVEPSSDPSSPDEVLNCTAYEDMGDGSAFPFHPKCFELFQRVLAFRKGLQLKVRPLPDGDWELNTVCLDIDKDLLMEIFIELVDGKNQSLDISYGEPSPPTEQYWLANSGDEFFIADPGKRNDLAVDTIHDKWQVINYQPTTLFKQPLNDPFTRLPLELLLIITSVLPSRSLLSLLQASAHIRRGLGQDFSLWRRRFEDDMPWFYEIQDFLHGLASQNGSDAQGNTTSVNASILSEQSVSHFFAWADHAAKPRLGLKGPFMGIANRRRIWDVCKQVVDPYLTGLQEQPHPGIATAEEDEKAHFQSEVVCLDMPVITSPTPARFHTQSVLWARTWSELKARKDDFTLDVFFLGDRLMGLGLVMENDESTNLKLFGHDDSERERFEEVSVKSMQIGSEDWVTGFILHSGNLRPYNSMNGPGKLPDVVNQVKGITVLCSSGYKETFGRVDPGGCRRPLLASKGMTIVGLIGHYVPEEEGFLRFGLLQVPTPGIDGSNDHGVVTSAEHAPVPTWAESRAWKGDGTGIFTAKSPALVTIDALPTYFPRTESSSGIPIWDVQNLSIQQFETQVTRPSVPRDFVPYSPLIWAKDVEEAKALRRLTGDVRKGNIANGFETDITLEQPVQHLCGVRAEFAPESGLEGRHIGSMDIHNPLYAPHCAGFDIDGAGGEMIIAVAVAMEKYTPKAIKLITNRGRETYWGEADKAEESWQIMTAPEGEMLIGIVGAFSRPSAFHERYETCLRSKISFVAALSLPMK